MTLKEIQVKIAALLNADETLLQGGCMAFAEDTLDGCILYLGWDGGAKSTLTTFYKTKKSADAFEAGTRP